MTKSNGELRLDMGKQGLSLGLSALIMVNVWYQRG